MVSSTDVSISAPTGTGINGRGDLMEALVPGGGAPAMMEWITLETSTKITTTKYEEMY